MFRSHADTFKAAVDSGEFPNSYRKGIKPMLLEGAPTFKYGVLLEDTATEPSTMQYIGNLDAIPERYSSLNAQDHLVMLRQDAFTTLKDIKRFHAQVAREQGVDNRTILEQCSTMDLSLDGVRESQHAKRTLYIVSCRLGNAIYVVAIYNHLLGVGKAKPNVQEVLE